MKYKQNHYGTEIQLKCNSFFHLIMVVNNGPAIVSAWIGGFELIPRTNIKQICNKYNICKCNGCLEIPSLAVNIDLASIPELRVLTREGVASCK